MAEERVYVKMEFDSDDKAFKRMKEETENSVQLIRDKKIFNQYAIDEIKDKKYLTIQLNEIDRIDEVLQELTKYEIDLNNKYIVIKVGQNAYLTKQQCEKLLNTRNALNKNGAGLKIKDGDWWELEDILEVNSHIDSVVNQIKSATVEENGKKRPLNEMEKFLMAYTFVANRKYQANQKDSESSRTITSIFKTGDIVCAGFATLLKEVCTRLNIECYENSCTVIEKSTGESYGHANNVVIIDNKPYYCDACFDCIKKNRKERTFNYCLISYEDIKHLQRLNIVNCTAPFLDIDNDKQYIQHSIEEVKKAQQINSQQYAEYKNEVFSKYISFIEKFSEPSISLSKFSFATNMFGPKDYKKELLYYLEKMFEIINKKQKTTTVSLSDFETSLNNIYQSNGYTEEQSHNKVAEIIDINVQRAGEDFEQEATNCFAKEYNKSLEL